MDPRDGPTGRHARIELPASATAPGLARHFVTATLRRTPSAAVADDAVLVVTELITNAIRHSGTAVVLTVDADPDGVRVEVHDGGGRLLPRPAPAGAESGRGLGIVDHLASAWGIETVAGDGKTVWAELRR